MRTRQQQIKFHIKSDDYFGTLAAKIDLAKQTFEKDSNKTKENEVKEDEEPPKITPKKKKNSSKKKIKNESSS